KQLAKQYVQGQKKRKKKKRDGEQLARGGRPHPGSQFKASTTVLEKKGRRTVTQTCIQRQTTTPTLVTWTTASTLHASRSANESLQSRNSRPAGIQIHHTSCRL